MRELYPTECEVKQRDGVRVGRRYRVRAEVLVRYRVAGLGEDSIARHSKPDRVVRIVHSARYGWTSVFFERGDVYSPRDLEPARLDRRRSA